MILTLSFLQNRQHGAIREHEHLYALLPKVQETCRGTEMVIRDYPQCCPGAEKEFLRRVKAAADNSVPDNSFCGSKQYQDQIEIRAELVCWILKNTSQVEGHITRLNLPGGKIIGLLDLSLNAIGIIVCFQSCTFDSRFGIADCRFASLELHDCRGPILGRPTRRDRRAPNSTRWRVPKFQSFRRQCSRRGCHIRHDRETGGCRHRQGGREGDGCRRTALRGVRGSVKS